MLVRRPFGALEAAGDALGDRPFLRPWQRDVEPRSPDAEIARDEEGCEEWCEEGCEEG